VNFHGLVPFIFYIGCLKKAFVKGNYWLRNIPPGAGQRLHRPLERLTPNPKLKFMEPCREVMRFHRLALRTEEAYLQWIKRFLVFCRDHPHLTPALSPPSEGAERERHWRHPQEMGEREVKVKGSSPES
jgi:hypothetical protein